MKSLQGLLLSLIIAEAQSSLLSTLKNIPDLIKPPLVLTIKLKLLGDIIASRQRSDIVIIANLDDLAEVLKTDLEMENVAILEPNIVANQTIEDLRIMYLKDNKPGFYILLPSIADTDENLKDLMSTIQAIDFSAKIAVVYEDMVDVEVLYRDKDIYNIYIFNPRYGFVTDIETEIIYKMITVCRYCADGDDLLELANTWRLNTGFSQPVQFKWSFTGNFHKR